MSRAIVLLLALAVVSTFAVPQYPTEDSCGQNQQFNYCATACEPTCRDPTPSICTQNCVIGCECKSGFFRNGIGDCVLTQDCME